MFFFVLFKFPVWNIDSILTVRGFPMWKLTYALKFLGNPEVSASGALWSLTDGNGVTLRASPQPSSNKALSCLGSAVVSLVPLASHSAGILGCVTV